MTAAMQMVHDGQPDARWCRTGSQLVHDGQPEARVEAVKVCSLPSGEIYADLRLVDKNEK